MSCNPAIGGLAKGQAVREIDALGGLMGWAADRTGIQFKVLNASRGPAVQGLRCQSDKAAYSREVGRRARGPAESGAEGGGGGRVSSWRGGLSRVFGSRTGEELGCGAAVVTSGTFLRGLIHVGAERQAAGRWGEAPCVGLSDALRGLGLRIGRMKTGTPPRVAGKSVDRSKTSRVTRRRRPEGLLFPSPGWSVFRGFAQVDCLLTHTTARTHDLIRRNLDRSPLYSGVIAGRGPRYCPSIEDKVVRFAERERHQIFVEPEGLDTDWTYLSGLSMSLPADVQEEVVRSLPGLEQAEILRPAYAIEYDVVFPGAARRHTGGAGAPRALPRGTDQRDLRLRGGGRTGARGGGERGARGEGAGAGAVHARAPRGLHRGDDRRPRDARRRRALPTPHLAGRASAPARGGHGLRPARWRRAWTMGFSPRRRRRRVREREERQRAARAALGESRVLPDRGTLLELEAMGVGLSEETTGAGLLRRPDAPASLRGWLAGRIRGPLGDLDDEEWERLVNEIRYEGFLKREREVIERVRRAADRPVPAGLPVHGACRACRPRPPRSWSGTVPGRWARPAGYRA